MSHVFISYSKKNQEYAHKLADHLINQGFDVWIDDRIDYGEDWWRTIVRNIRNAKAFIVIMTDEADASEWVQREVTLADKHKIPAFPIWLDGNFHESENWAIYVRTQYADLRGDRLPSDDFYRRVEKVVPKKESVGNNKVAASDSSKLVAYGKIDDVPVEFPITIEKEPKVHPKQTSVSILPPDVSSILPPPFEWCEIPMGEVTIEYSATDHKVFDVPQFWMAKYPITNAQYQVFIEAKDGYCEPEWWKFSDEAKSWRRISQAKNLIYKGHDLPRTNVSWYETVAFCRWLNEKLNYANLQTICINLPTEQEWQRAAQGDDRYIYPWGNQFDSNNCNSGQSGNGQPTPVTQYGEGISPYGVMDMSGNVWEWCLTKWDTGEIDLAGDDIRVARGGSFNFNQGYVSNAARHFSRPDDRLNPIGFRVVSLFSSPHH